VGVVRGLVQKQVLHDDAFHRGKARRDVPGVGVGLQNVLALDVDALERAVERGVQHVGDAQAGLVVETDPPQRLEHRAGRLAGNMTVAGELVGERAYVARALQIVLPAQRVHADAGTPDVAGRHGEVGDGDHRGRALAVLGDAEAVVDRAVSPGGVEAGGGADHLRRNAGDLRHRLGAVARLGDERRPVLEFVPVAPLAHESLVDQAFGDDHMGERREHRDIGAGQQGQMMRGFHVRRAHQIDAAGIDHDQPGALAQALLHARGEHRMGVGRIGADQHCSTGYCKSTGYFRGAIGLINRSHSLGPRRLFLDRARSRQSNPPEGPRCRMHDVLTGLRFCW
jgi:hypothetical protein